jgi:hypothetical protein
LFELIESKISELQSTDVIWDSEIEIDDFNDRDSYYGYNESNYDSISSGNVVLNAKAVSTVMEKSWFAFFVILMTIIFLL